MAHMHQKNDMQPTTNQLALGCLAKGEIKPKADWRAIDYPKKRLNEFVFFAMTVPKILET